MRRYPPRLSPLAVIVAVMLTVLPACQKVPAEPQLPAPEELPDIPILEFTEHDEGWPPQVRGIADVELVPWETVPSALTVESEAEILDQLLQDEEVTAMLGERFAYITVEVIEPEKENGRAPGFNAVFFSHSNNSTVKVQLDNALESRAIEKVEPSIYQPPAGPTEFDEAISAAREALIGLDFDLAGLQSNAILAYPNERESPNAYFYDRRVIYVSFSEGEDAPPSLFALVDLTNQKILDSGAAAGSVTETR